MAGSPLLGGGRSSYPRAVAASSSTSVGAAVCSPLPLLPPDAPPSTPSSPQRPFLDIFLSDRYRNLRLSSSSLTHSRPNGASGDGGPPSSASTFLSSPLNLNSAAVYKFFTEGCLVRSLMLGVGGGGLGLLFGTFFFAMRPVDIDTSLSFREQIRMSYKGFGKEVLSTAKGFAKLSAVYSLMECFFERERAVHDMTTAVYAGCATGAFFAWKNGPGAMASSCVMFAAFSAAMEHIQPFGGDSE